MPLSGLGLQRHHMAKQAAAPGASVSELAHFTPAALAAPDRHQLNVSSKMKRVLLPLPAPTM